MEGVWTGLQAAATRVKQLAAGTATASRSNATLGLDTCGVDLTFAPKR
jgi:hypothetical protein